MKRTTILLKLIEFQILEDVGEKMAPVIGDFLANCASRVAYTGDNQDFFSEMGKSFRKNFRMFCKHFFCINMEKYRKTLFYLENLSFFVLEKNCICLGNRLFKFFFHEIVAYFFLTKFRIVFLSQHSLRNFVFLRETFCWLNESQ